VLETMTAHQAKVVIVGAGPAGSAAAIRLAQLGVPDVVLVDRDKFPRDKTCGSGLSPTALHLLTELGVQDEVADLGYPIRWLYLRSPGGRDVRLGGTAVAAVLLRRLFDEILVRRAQALGVEFRDGIRVDELIKEDDRVVGVRGGGDEIRAALVFCADGAHSRFSVDPRPRRLIQAVMGWWEGVPFDPETLEMYFDRRLTPLYGWMFPETAERVNIGITIDHQRLVTRSARKIRTVFEDFLEANFSRRLAGARMLGKWQGHAISHTTRIGRVAAPGVAYVGEAARLTNCATGEGISQAMESGIFAAEAAAEVLDGSVREIDAWDRYRRRLRRRFTPEFLAGHLVRGIVRTQVLEGVVAVAASDRARRTATWALGSALTGHQLQDQANSNAEPQGLDPASRR
jgi:geranylgeranyl reductase family protein